MTISNEIKENLILNGASIVGFADLSIIPKQNRKGYKYGIVVGVALNPKAVLSIKDGPSEEYYNEGERVDNLLNSLDEYAAKMLIDNGYEALAKTQSIVKIDNNKKRTELPHKTIATRAGIGWIGKCALLVTKKYGSAIRLSTALTNAKLDVGTPIDTCKCGNCTKCKDICPSHAVYGKPWNVNLDRDEFFNAFNCKGIILERGKAKGWNKFTCGLCILACPYTQRYIGI